MADNAFTEEIRWASMALAANLDSSDDQRPTVRMRSLLYRNIQSHKIDQRVLGTYGTQLA